MLTREQFGIISSVSERRVKKWALMSDSRSDGGLDKITQISGTPQLLCEASRIWADFLMVRPL